MQFHPRLSPKIAGFPDFPEAPVQAGDFLAARDAVELLQLIASLAPFRSDPRAWRMELLSGLNGSLAAYASAAFVLRHVNGDSAAPTVASFFHAGFVSDTQGQAFVRQINSAPFRDPFSRAVLDRFSTGRFGTLTCLRSDVLDDKTWNADPHMLAYRRAAGCGDCLLSLERSAERGTAYALLAFKPAGDSPGATPHFSPRERLLMDTLHRGLAGLYRGEESVQKLNRAAGLTPRLRETLEFLLNGDTERQVAMKLSLSVHTVHDYVKALYLHFGVSSRTELLAKWMHTGGQLPKRSGKPESPS